MEVGERDELQGVKRVRVDRELRARPREAADLGAEMGRGRHHRLIGRAFGEDDIARLDQRRHGEHIGHRGAVGHHHGFGRHALLRGDRLAERRVAIVARAIEFELHRVDLPTVHAKMRDLAGAERKSDRRAGLGPVHIVRSHRPHEAEPRRLCQNRKAGIPAARIKKPIALFFGSFHSVAATMIAQASTTAVVTAARR